MTPSNTLKPIPAIAAGCLLAVGLLQVFANNWMPDLFIQRGGTILALAGESPYRIESIRDLVRPQFPHEEHMTEHCGFFLPPSAITLYAPFALLPWTFAQVLYVLLSPACGLACTKLPQHRMNILPALVLLNFLAYGNLQLGQTTILTAGAVAAGLLCFQRQREWLGTFLWSVAFLKPHIALPLLPLAWYLGGLRRLALVTGWLAILTVLAMGITRQPLLPLDFLRFLQSSDAALDINRLGTDPQMSGWSVCLWAASGHEINLGILETLMGYAVWGLVVVARCWNKSPTWEWALAAAAVGSLNCCQVHAYEHFALVLTLPLLFRLPKWWKWALATLFLIQSLPIEMIAPKLPPYRCWLVLASGLVVLTSPPRLK